MAKPIDPTCLACSALTQPAAIALHSSGGEGRECWDETRCPRKRSHYRHRKKNNDKQRIQYHTQKVANQAVEVEPSIFVPLELPFVAYLYLYRGPRQDARLHAISVSIWQGNDLIDEVLPIHCAGLKNRQVNAYLQQVLAVLNQKYGIAKFEASIRLEPQECPLPDCPLKGGRVDAGATA